MVTIIGAVLSSLCCPRWHLFVKLAHLCGCVPQWVRYVRSCHTHYVGVRCRVTDRIRATVRHYCSVHKPALPATNPWRPCPFTRSHGFTFTTFQAPTRSQQLGDVDTIGGAGDSLSSAGGHSSSAEFAFAAEPSRRVRSRRAPQFSFARATPAKRSRSRRDEGQRALSLASDGGDEQEEATDLAGTYEFSISTYPPQRPRRTRARVERGVDSGNAGPADGAAGSSIPSAVASLEVVGQVGLNSGRNFGGSMSSAAAPAPGLGAGPARAPITNGFDMSKFSKPGEWKCEACFVKNPPGGDKCLSCETPKPGGSGAGQGGSAPSSGGLLPNVSSSSTRFTFGVQPGTAATGNAAGASSVPAAAASAGSADSAVAPLKGGFDMSRFSTPGEWKCGSCLVKNGPGVRKCLACETPKPDSLGDVPEGGGLSGAGAPATGGSLFGTQTLPPLPSFSFGMQATAAAAPSAEPPRTATFTFGVQPGGGGDVSVAGSGATTALGGSAPAPAPVANGFDMSKFTKPGEWKCGSCLVKNGPGVIKCLSCETPKEDSVAAGDGRGQTATSSGVPAAVSGAGFGSTSGGIVAVAPSSGAAAHATFQFGAATPSSVSGAPAAGTTGGSGFVLGAASTSAPAAPSPAPGASSSSSAPGFRFGAVDISAAPAAGAGDPWAAFGAIGGFQFSAPGSMALPGAATLVTSAASGGSFGTRPGQERFGAPISAASSAAGSGGSNVQTSGTSIAAPVFRFGSGSLPAPESATRAAAPVVGFGAGSLPAPANPASNNSNAPRAPLFSFGAGAGAPAAGVAPSSAPMMTFGGGAGGGASSSSAAPGSSTGFNFTPRFTPKK